MPFIRASCLAVGPKPRQIRQARRQNVKYRAGRARMVLPGVATLDRVDAIFQNPRGLPTSESGELIAEGSPDTESPPNFHHHPPCLFPNLDSSEARATGDA